MSEKGATHMERGKTKVNPMSRTGIGSIGVDSWFSIHGERYRNKYRCKCMCLVCVCMCISTHIFPNSFLREALGAVIYQ